MNTKYKEELIQKKMIIITCCQGLGHLIKDPRLKLSSKYHQSNIIFLVFNIFIEIQEIDTTI